MIQSVNLKWKGDMSFVGEIDGHEIPLDVSVDAGGKDAGPRPKKLMLLALAGCTAMDVVSILKKMRVEVKKFSIDVEANQSEVEHPYVYEWYKVIYYFDGNNLDDKADMITKAVNLSQEKYCGVSAMLRQSAPVTHEIRINQK